MSKHLDYFVDMTLSSKEVLEIYISHICSHMFICICMLFTVIDILHIQNNCYKYFSPIDILLLILQVRQQLLSTK